MREVPHPRAIDHPERVNAALMSNTRLLDVLFEAGLRRDARLAREAQNAPTKVG